MSFAQILAALKGLIQAAAEFLASLATSNADDDAKAKAKAQDGLSKSAAGDPCPECKAKRQQASTQTSPGQPAAPKVQAPTATELTNNPTVKAAMAQAWQDSNAGDPAHRHEEGGWIYMDPTTGAVTVRRQASGATAGIDLSQPPDVPGSVIVGKFHTHPNPTSEGWLPGPSDQDIRVDALHGVPDLIQADDGVHLSGPDSRRGGMGGGSGFPP